jgi:hypothetical protein
MAGSTDFCFKPRDWPGLGTEERATMSVAVQRLFRRLYGEQSHDKKTNTLYNTEGLICTL